MINVKNTIYSTIKDRVDKLRFLAVNNSTTFKKILYLIIMDDVYDWSSYLGGSQEIQDRIQELRYDFIRHNEEFLIERDIDTSIYVNVNTPQTNNTWKRVWDSPNVVLLQDNQFNPITTSKTFTPDPNCKIGMVFFPDEKLFGGISVGNEGQPIVNLNDLTTCDKMNIFVNRNTGVMYYLDESCNWKPITQQFVGNIKKEQLAFDIYEGLEHTILDDDLIVSLTTSSDHSTAIDLATKEDLEDIL